MAIPTPAPAARRVPRRRLRPAAGVSLALTTAFGLALGLLSVVGPADSTATPARAAALTRDPPRPTCAVSTTLVPACGRWVGVAPLPHTGEALQTALPKEETFAGRPVDIVHVYHTNAQLFPTAAERAVALQTGHQRLLLENWKPATDMSWAAVAAGHADARIDRLAKYLNLTYRHRFFLDIWHEPENDVNPAVNSGYTATDYASMYRHVVSRLRGDGVTFAVTVMNYMGFVNWTKQSWFSQLWPGDSYVDWVATDPYGTGAATSTYTATNFPTLVNRPVAGSFPGFYSWVQKYHPGKPMMLAEWGVGYVAANRTGQARFFADVAANIAKYPMLKALVYFDMPTPPAGQPRTYLAAGGTSSLDAYRALVHNSAFVAPRIAYN